MLGFFEDASASEVVSQADIVRDAMNALCGVPSRRFEYDAGAIVIRVQAEIRTRWATCSSSATSSVLSDMAQDGTRC